MKRMQFYMRVLLGISAILIFKHLEIVGEGMVGMRSCVRCNGAEDERACDKTTCFQDDEMCFTDKLIASNLNVVFNAGCRAKSVCDRMRSGDLTVYNRVACAQCCNDTELCNEQLCGLQEANALNLTESDTLRCLKCDSALSIDGCSGYVACDNRTEECFADVLITANFEIAYDAGCRSREQCGSSVKRSGPGDLGLCSRCCARADDCNKNLCGIRSSQRLDCGQNPCKNGGKCHSDGCHCPLGYTGQDCSEANSTICFSCRGKELLEQCTDVTTCQDDEVCYIAQYQDSNSYSKLYDSGCRAKTRCQSSGANDCTMRCCDSDYCNDHSCAVPEYAMTNPMRGPVCFNCHSLDAMSFCKTVTQCNVDEECIVYGDSFLGYTSQCVKQQYQCGNTAGGQVFGGNSCHFCCRQDFCNNNCTQHNQPTQVIIG